MKLENQVVSLELAKKLKELGFKQDSLYYWAEDENFIVTKDKIENSQDWRDNYFIPAYTVPELGEMLPLKIDDEDLTIWREKGFESWDVAYSTLARKEEVWEQSKNLVDAMAKMAIYLLENNLIKL